MKGRILIIDDEATLRHSLTRILQGAGHAVTTAANGREGLDYLSQQPFDLVYLDIRMPDMSGLEVLRIVHRKFPLVSVILFTAQPDLNSAIQAMREGAIDYLLKPLKPQLIIERTNILLVQQEREHRKREIQSQIEELQTELLTLENTEVVLTEKMKREIETEERFLIRGRLKFDLHARRLSIGKNSINLPPTSFDYLLVLARHAPKVVDYQTLIVEAQGYQADPREAQELIKWHIHHIRQAIEPNVAQPKYVINVRGIGYRLVAD
jgi:DNA-binding response OmpR family regulator